MYLYDISKQKQQIVKRNIGSKQTRLVKRLSKNRTKKLTKTNLDGGFSICMFGLCHMPKDIYKRTKQDLLTKITDALNIPKDNEKYRDIIKDGIDQGFLREFLHGIYSKMGSSKRELLEETYLEYIKTFIKLLIISANPEGVAYTFPTKYKKFNSSGEQTDETDSKTAEDILISRNIITTETLANYIDSIIKADKQNLQNIDVIRRKNRSTTEIKEINKFIFDDKVAGQPADKRGNYDINRVLYFYNTSSCSVTEKGDIQQPEMCKVVFTFNTKQSTSLADRDLTRNDFAMVESNFKMIKTYALLLTNTTKHSKQKKYKKRIISLLTDSYKIKSYIEGCINFFKYMEKYKSLPGESPSLFMTSKST